MNQQEKYTIENTSLYDWDLILDLFEKAIKINHTEGYKVWTQIDESGLKKDISNHLQYKIYDEFQVLGIFSIQYNDPFIWREKDRNDSLYLHRLVVNRDCKGARFFYKVLCWAIDYAKVKEYNYIRMDTWADNEKIISYYKSYGFQFIEKYKTGNEPKLPLQNRNLEVALLQLDLTKIDY